ncbi:DUF2442 domain-containing protein [Jiella sp. M17.18]|uniref:DUF2442 domain-containing protein n=1 Tax=Jiella sp. M17.18 TaxID=3234247 RepID=UPI0034DEBFC5
MDDLLDEGAYRAAVQAGEEERRRQPLPAAATYDRRSGRIVVEFENGAAFMVPARLLQGLQDASDDDLASVELLGETGLHWEALDVDLSIAGLMAGIFGTARFMAQRGGASRSPAKASAARANGAKGGRPKKAGS